MTDQSQLAAELFEEADILFVSIELAQKEWKLAFSDGNERVVKTIDARHFGHLQDLISTYIQEFDLSDDPHVVSCYEAGQDGFWVHRVLVEQLQIQNVVIDPASIEDNQRGKQAKTDPIDARKLVRKLIAYHRGDEEVFSICRVPSRQIEDDRRINRELKRLKKERTAQRNGIRGLLRQQGIEVENFGLLEEKLDQLETGDGKELGTQQKREVRRRLRRLELINQQIKDVIAERKQTIQQRKEEPVVMIIDRLRALRGIALDSAWRLTMEAFAWRDFENRGQIGGCFGLDPTPYNSGESENEQGISKAGSTRLRKMAIQVAWNWIRNQPDSHLTRWFKDKFNMDSKNDRKRGITAVARKLMIRLYKWATDEEAEKPWGSTLNKGHLIEKAE